jgi:hypothetical protein|tara:strand:- start:661 stop:936 length:276 start_codon:yes stop_codon:yes gene_type:complete
MDIRELKIQIIQAGKNSVQHLIQVANEKIIKIDPEDELAADRLKNAAAAKKLAIFDAFDILQRIQEEEDRINGVEREKNNLPKGFAESKSK